ncbi:YeeE/YedE family protein [Allorhizobium undicola]|uniref:YeeE/YedE family protein n=1 Tax=Allorhizobium undicola TaxID=78527 RepID=UPI0004880D8E|nr:YeeE/YedE thiosulfate transporter family protein [Allorhizobium undicola]
MSHFSVLSAVGGGLLIGFSAALFLLLHGRIAGVSGLADQALNLSPRASLFVIGIFAGAWFFQQVNGLDDWEITGSIPMLIAGGLLVGFGTRLGSGCTSGHGVCGLGRFSRRSFAAVICFMAVAFATVFVVHTFLRA